MDKPTGLALLRVPFPKHQISKLPKPTRNREFMDTLPKAKCAECGGYHATTHVIHLDYVGHAALTDRLLDADPAWNWEPLAMSPDGLPVLDPLGGMWIKLTVCNVTRIGYGHASGKEGGDAIKELIGDALRNAAMRFGAALELWHKGDLHGPEAMAEEDILAHIALINASGNTSEFNRAKNNALLAAGEDAIAVARINAAAATKIATEKAKKATV